MTFVSEGILTYLTRSLSEQMKKKQRHRNALIHSLAGSSFTWQDFTRIPIGVIALQINSLVVCVCVRACVSDLYQKCQG